MGTADLHIHSMYSDGTMTIEEIAQEAIRQGVTLLAVSDHDMLKGARRLQELVKEKNLYQKQTMHDRSSAKGLQEPVQEKAEHDGLICIPAVEINTLDRGRNVHILGYHVDLDDSSFDEFINNNRRMLDDVSVQLIRKMEKDYEQISLAEFANYTYDRTKGGFEALHYLNEKGLTQTLKEGFRFYEIYDCPYSCVNFPDIPTAIEKVHRAGGVAVLAHPGVTIPEKEPGEFEKELLRYVAMGIDGIECYYPLHPDWMIGMCVRICEEKGLFITAGSDCHGSFGTAGINQMNISADRVTLPVSLC
ncbi:MAG: PHP domain-containing protein [Lachnospiraceae bacterium]|nr:PHP domain-containing protein [Lachnospiraceae bacterium]